MNNLDFLWLELTGKCQLCCEHCYAESGPGGHHGAMTFADWARTLAHSSILGARRVQFIGGEPTLYRRLPELIDHALSHGLKVEVFSNLVNIPDRLWDTFEQTSVQLATSYYADNAMQHEAITKRRGSYTRTKANIVEALRRSIPLRVGVIDVKDGQRVQEARAELARLGVLGDVHVDHLRQIGRGVRERPADLDQLCGQCARSKIAVSPTGDVWPCVFSRWLPLGNVRRTELAQILAGPRLAAVASALSERFGDQSAMGGDPCDPACGPNCSPACLPSCWPTGTGPCGPNGGCQPNYD